MNDFAETSHAPFLAERTLSFNLMPCLEMDETWLAFFSHGQVCSAIGDNPDAESQIAQYLLDTFNLTNQYWCEFSAPRMRVALLDRYTLQKVCLYVGLVLRGAELRAEVSRAALERLRRDIGGEAMDFLFKTAPLIGAPRALAVNMGADDTRLDLMALGASYSIHYAAADDNAYTKRFLMRLPQKSADAFQRYLESVDPDEKSDALPPVTRRVIKEAAPQWLALFN